jgi:hypothetical protein
VNYGDEAVFSGVATNADGSPAANVRVALQKIGKSGDWVTVVRTTSGRDGGWTARYRWIRTGRIRARTDTAISPSTVVPVIPEIQASARARHVSAGDAVALSGSVQPSSSVFVLVERKDSRGRWRRITTARARVRRGRFTANLRLKSAGLYRLTPWTGKTKAPVIYVRAVRGATGGTAA